MNRKENFLCAQKKYKREDRLVLDARIAEYDITKANISILFDRGLITNEERERFIALPKLQREIEIGRNIRDKKINSSDIADGIAEAKIKFMQINHYNDEDIFMIDNDALFIINKPIAINMKVGIATEFRLDNLWNSYCRLGNGLELFYFYDRIKNIDGYRAKGLGSASSMHEGYMSDFFKELFYISQTQGIQQAMSFIQTFYKSYQSKSLDTAFYRRYSADSRFDIKVDSIVGARYSTDIVSRYQINDLDIAYNEAMIREVMGLFTSKYFDLLKRR